MKQETIRFKKANPIHLAQIVKTLINDLGIGPDIFLKKLKQNWPRIVGNLNANNTRPFSLEAGILTLKVSSPAWSTQARFYKSTFIKNIKDFEPENNVEIRDMKFILESY